MLTTAPTFPTVEGLINVGIDGHMYPLRLMHDATGYFLRINGGNIRCEEKTTTRRLAYVWLLEVAELYLKGTSGD